MAPLPGVEPPQLARAKVLNETTWLFYCCCEGCGLGPFADPLIAQESKQLCLRTSVTTRDLCGPDGACNSVQVCLCVTEQCQLPPLEDAPTCACFNKRCGGTQGSTKWHDPNLFEKAKVMDETFWLYYFVCVGCGFNKMDQGLFASQFKELCCGGFTNIEPPIIEGICCSSVSTQCCIWGECQMPPASPNPKCAICSWRMNKEPFVQPAQAKM